MSRSSSTDETPSESFLTDEEIETFEYLLENAENFPTPSSSRDWPGSSFRASRARR